ncbi:hypothetical protein L916_18149 [Phytophthora nicotianae]|uniref:HAT C-terminal dimerisation domain-containing protein n=1 Tax=Phytophthora nicotianae TaxID=4792 RepID=W2I2R0_PHYNI|nr:hypothetical protein L916_18149 [Phytophthora nicotianae]
MSGGKTSKVTLHLSKAHDVGSDKTASEEGRKRTRDEDLAVLKRSPLFRYDPGRAFVLLETLRIVNNNLPFRIGEYEKSLIIRDLMLKEEARVALNAKVIRHSVVELYDATKRQVQAMLTESRIGSAKSYSVVADFRTASAMNTNFLGLRLYLVDSSYRFKSVLLGTQHFAPQYGERDGGIRGPFYRWIGDVLEDFRLSRHDLFGSTSDGGPDVKWMMRSGLKLCWEWCVLHFTHAATKTAFGIVAESGSSKNPAMTDMLRRIVKTVYQTHHVVVMGTLFSELCSVMTDEDVLSLLEPISVINHIGQSESGNQCDVLLGLYKLRISLLDVTPSLRDCRSTKTERRFFRPEELSNLATTTRKFLHKAFHRVFFRRYTDREVMNSCSYAFEMQLLLHPNFKNPVGALKKVILMSNLQAGASQQVADRHFIKVRRKIIDGVRRIMEAVDTQPTPPGIVAPPPVAVLSGYLMELFAETANEVAPPPVDTHTAMHEQRIDEELDRWLSTPTSLKVIRPGEFEPVLSFWKRQHDQGNFRHLSLVARVLFSMPSSSSQIERDFETAGRMGTPQRSSLSPYYVDMATFLNCNRDYVDITQCPKLSTNAAAKRLPSNVLVNMTQDLDDEFGSLENMFSAASMDLGLSDNEEGTEG